MVKSLKLLAPTIWCVARSGERIEMFPAGTKVMVLGNRRIEHAGCFLKEAVIVSFPPNSMAGVLVRYSGEGNTTSESVGNVFLKSDFV
jgi:hypothetical protein